MFIEFKHLAQYQYLSMKPAFNLKKNSLNLLKSVKLFLNESVLGGSNFTDLKL